MPTRAEAVRSRLFAPIAFGALDLEQRTWVPAMVPWRATEEGYVTDAIMDWYVRFARGRPGAIVVEATGIRDVPSGPLLRIGHDRFLPGLRRLQRCFSCGPSTGRTKALPETVRSRRSAPSEDASSFQPARFACALQNLLRL